jgi:hypothetical protein
MGKIGKTEQKTGKVVKLRDPLYVSRLRIGGGDIFVVVLLVVAVVAAAAAIPTFAGTWLGLSSSLLRTTAFVVLAFVGLFLTVHFAFREKAILTLTRRGVVLRYPLRLWARHHFIDYIHIEHIRVGETSAAYWLKVFLTPQPGKPNELEFKFEAYEEDVEDFGRELHGLGLSVVVYGELP